MQMLCFQTLNSWEGAPRVMNYWWEFSHPSEPWLRQTSFLGVSYSWVVKKFFFPSPSFH